MRGDGYREGEEEREREREREMMGISRGLIVDT